MEKTATIKAKDLVPAAREWLRSILHVDFADTDEFTVTLRQPVKVPTPEQRQAAARELKAVMDRMAENMEGVSEQEFNAALDEAMKAVRPTYERPT